MRLLLTIVAAFFGGVFLYDTPKETILGMSLLCVATSLLMRGLEEIWK